MTIYKQVDSRGIVRHYVQELETWDDFDAIVSKVIRSLGATVLKQGDGPDSRYCALSVDGLDVFIVHDDMLGNCFFSAEEDAGGVIERIAKLFSATGGK